MSLKEELAKLELQRDAELRHATYTYARLKRDVERKISPAHYVRKHVWTSLTTAAVLGFLAAPPEGRAKPAQSRRVGFLRMILRQIPGLDGMLPQEDHQPQEPAPAPKPAKHTHWRGMIADLAMHLLQQLNWTAIFAALTQGLQKPKPQEETQEPAEPLSYPVE